MKRFALAIAIMAILRSAPARMEFTENAPLEKFPERLRKHAAAHPVDKGFVDITRAPYNAAGDGKTDDTDAIQHAVDDAFRSNLCVLFPPGVYLVSRQIRCIQLQMGRQWSNHKFAHVLVGSTQGERRPVIKAKDGLSFQPNDKRHGGKRELIFFQYYAHKPFRNRFNPEPTVGVYRHSVHYSSQFRGIDIDMGENPDFSAISMVGAQFCAIEDVTITGNFDAGIDGLPGCGGGTVNVRIVGGKVGIRQTQYRPNPTVTGLVCEGQSRCGVEVTMSMGPVVLTGFRIVAPPDPSSAYRAIRTECTWNRKGTDQSPGALVLSDGAIDVPGESALAIENFDQDLVMRDVYFRAATIADSGTLHPEAGRHTLRGRAGAWLRVARYAFSPASSDGYIHTGGKELSHGTGKHAVFAPPPEAASPPDDLVGRHVWREDDFPAWDRPDALDIVEHFGATRDDDSDDDAPAVQRAIDATTTPGGPDYGKTVFIPRGHFHIGRPIVVQNGARIVGAANTISVLHIKRDWQPGEETFAMDSASDPEGRASLAHFAILGHKPNATQGTLAQRRLGLLRIALGDTTVRDIQLAREYARGIEDFAYDTPGFAVGPGGGGKVYQFVNHMTDIGDVAPGYHKILVRGNARPLRFYQVSAEHIHAGVGAQVRLENARDVRIYGLKHEKTNHILDAVDSSDVWVMGGLSNAPCPPYTDALIHLENCPGACFAVMASYAQSVAKACLKSDETAIGDDALLTWYEGQEP